MNVTFRPASDSDTEFARITHHAAYREVVTREFGSFEDIEQDGFFQKAWDLATHQIIIYEGKPVGYCSVSRFEDHIFLDSLVVSPEFQGQGIGSHILKQLVAEGDRNKLSVRLRVFKSNKAVELYQRAGFKIIEDQDKRFVMEYNPTQ